ncbi:28451_t:CDS:1, partial [Racocetra persica]
MPQKKNRKNATVACINCRERHEKCNVLSGENKCKICNKRNWLCIFTPGNKRGPKSVAKADQREHIINLSPPFIHDERMPNDSQNITPFPNSFSTSNSFSPYNYTTNINIYKTT